MRTTYRLGDSGLQVSPLCLGTMMFGDRTDEAASQRRSSAKAHDAGFNFIDTADVYTKGASERIVGAGDQARIGATGSSRPSAAT